MVSLRELVLGDVVKLTHEQAVNFGIDARLFIVQETDEANGPGLRPVSIKKLKTATSKSPVLLKKEEERPRTFSSPTRVQKVERVGRTTVENRPFRSGRVFSPYNTPLTQVKIGSLVKTPNEYFVILNKQEFLEQRGGATLGVRELRVSVMSIQKDASLGIVETNQKLISIRELGHGNTPRVRVLGQVSKGYKISQPKDPSKKKQSGELYTPGDIFRFNGKLYLVRSAQEGTYTEQGIRPQATWELFVIELKEAVLSSIQEKGYGLITSTSSDMKIIQEGGYWGTRGDFRGQEEYLGSYNLELRLNQSSLSELINEGDIRTSAPRLELPVVYDYVREP